MMDDLHLTPQREFTLCRYRIHYRHVVRRKPEQRVHSLFNPLPKIIHRTFQARSLIGRPRGNPTPPQIDELATMASISPIVCSSGTGMGKPSMNCLSCE